jgi:hypothetical protein
MADSGTVSIVEMGDDRVNSIRFDWTSLSDGTAELTTTQLEGEIIRFVINPGTPAPTASYDITLLDEDGLDLMTAKGVDVSATVTSQEVMTGGDTAVVPIAVTGPCTFAVANAGAIKAGSVKFYLRRR